MSKEYKGYKLIPVKELGTDMIAPMLNNGCNRDVSQMRAVNNLDSRVYVPRDYEEGDTTRSVSIGGNTNRIYGTEDDFLIYYETDNIDDLDIVLKSFEDINVGDKIPIKLSGLSDDRNLWVEVFEKKNAHRSILATVGGNYLTIDFYKQEEDICILHTNLSAIDTMIKVSIDYTGK